MNSIDNTLAATPAACFCFTDALCSRITHPTLMRTSLCWPSTIDLSQCRINRYVTHIVYNNEIIFDGFINTQIIHFLSRVAYQFFFRIIALWKNIFFPKLIGSRCKLKLTIVRFSHVFILIYFAFYSLYAILYKRDINMFFK